MSTDTQAVTVHRPDNSGAGRTTLPRALAAVATAAFVLATLAVPVSAASSRSTEGSCLTGGGYTHATAIGSLYNISRDMRAHRLWKSGISGEGIDVALIDTGVAPVQGLHHDDKIVNGPDFSFEAGIEEVRHLDTYGHGTHLAGIIAGNDVDTAIESHRPDEFQGVAPDARIVNLKVADHTGAVDVTQVIAAIDWAVANRNSNGLNIRVINLSYKAPGYLPHDQDPLSRAVQNAWNHGIVVVIAAGNDGQDTPRLLSPAHNPLAITVSARADAEQNATSCYYGKPEWEITEWATGYDPDLRRPDIYAPGASVVSLRNPGSMIDRLYPDSAVSDRFTRATGTSQSAAIVSGAVALLLSDRPEMTPDEVKAVLLGSMRTRLQTPLLNRAIRSEIPSDAEQNVAVSWGTGSLDNLRGPYKVRIDGRRIKADETPFGAWDAFAWKRMSTRGNAWTDSGWRSNWDATSSWTGSSWTGNNWLGSSWTGSSWTGSSWTGSSWTGSSWTGSSWTGSSWTGSSWTGSSWTGSNWE